MKTRRTFWFGAVLILFEIVCVTAMAVIGTLDSNSAPVTAILIGVAVVAMGWFVWAFIALCRGELDRR